MDMAWLIFLCNVILLTQLVHLLHAGEIAVFLILF